MINKAFNILILFSIIITLSIIVFLQLINPYLYEVDSYYHIKMPYFLREFGILHEFKWTQFSTFKNLFSDKEFLFHLFILPFTFLGKNVHTQAKISIIFLSLLFFLVYIFIQKKYVSKPILILSVISLILSIHFLVYINYLRPKTMAIILLLLFFYFHIEKKWIGVCVICILHPLSHVSFPLVIPLSIGIEFLRYLYNKKIFIKNIFYTFLGTIIGIVIHPNFPMNIFSFILNGVFVPWNTMFGNLKLDYGLEWTPANTQMVIIDFLILFTGIFFVMIIMLTKKPKINFNAIVFFFATGFFLFLSMFSTTYWYFTYPFGIIFLGMFFSDYLRNKSSIQNFFFILVIGLVLILKAFIINKQNPISNEFVSHIERNAHYERMGNWMNKHIPPGEIIYHTSWSDSPYFICLNPKDYYLNMLDPVYMYYYDPKIYHLYNNLSNGFCNKPVKILKKTFKINYGYTGKGYGLYNQIKSKKGVKILFEDEHGAIFQLVKKI